jgi:hypothetical protein|tara:strand:+ start:1865 stop:2059 length:195 start_codon:yes stop_codon:yes gene_type:complete
MCFQPAGAKIAENLKQVSPMGIAATAIEQKKLPVQVLADAAVDNNIKKPSDLIDQGGLGLQILK